jgi:general secretion pathway protein D
MKSPRHHTLRRFLTIALTGLLLTDAAAQPDRSVYNVDQMPLENLVTRISADTGRRFVMADRLEGKVTVIGGEALQRDQLLPLLVRILQSRGYTVRQEEDTFYIVKLDTASLGSGPVLPPSADPSDAAGLITRVLHIQHIGVTQLALLLQPLARSGAENALIAYPPSNHLIITDTTDSIRTIEAIIAELDQPGTTSAIEVVPLEHASAEALARQLSTALLGAEQAGSRLSRQMQQVIEGGAALASDTLVVAAPHANSLLLVGAPVDIAGLRDLITELDVETPSGYGRLNVIPLKYQNAEDVAANLNALLQRPASSEEGTARATIAVEPNIANNALLIDAPPGDYELVRALVERIDTPPQQVMVEILIAELTVGDSLDLGVEWASIDLPRDGSTTVLGRSRPGDQDTLQDLLTGAFPEGLSLGVARGTFTDPQGRILPRVPFLLRALAEDRDVKILSNIPLWAHNNAEASVSVVNNIPLLKSQTEGTGDNRYVTQEIEREDIGIQLKVTPYINPDDEVRMELNPVIQAIVDAGPSDTPFTPTIAKREVTTTVTIPDRATVVLSGLMREDNVRTVSKVPLLGDIPLLGALFRRTGDSKQRTNLLIFVTPHIVRDLEAAKQLRDTLEERTGIDRHEASIHRPVPATEAAELPAE